MPNDDFADANTLANIHQPGSVKAQIRVSASARSYIPLPPAPNQWETDEWNEFSAEISDKTLGPILEARYRKEYKIALKLAESIEDSRFAGPAGGALATCYRMLIRSQRSEKQLAAAANLANEMMLRLPTHFTDQDARNLRSLIAALDKSAIPHGLTPPKATLKKDIPAFTIRGPADCKLQTIQTIPKHKRPDTSFKDSFQTSYGTVMLAFRTRKTSDSYNTAAMALDNEGAEIATIRLDHGVHRVSSAPHSEYLSILSQENQFYVYDKSLKLVIKWNLETDHRIATQLNNPQSNWHDNEVGNRIRSVNAAPNGERFLFASEDELWCCSPTGKTIWHIQIPLKDGWKRVAKRSTSSARFEQIVKDLELFDLSLPIDPIEVKSAYRRLAFQKHPDRNPTDPNATEQMQLINAAFERITGIDPSTISLEGEEETYFTRTAESIKNDPRASAWMNPFVQDWIVETAWSNNGDIVIASHEGKIMVLSAEGEIKLAYDIGQYPRQIHAHNQRIYIACATRLWVVENRRILSFTDIFNKGTLSFSSNGFGLIQAKHVRWFDAFGSQVSAIESRDPIRIFAVTNDGAVIYSRTHYAKIAGAVV